MWLFIRFASAGLVESVFVRCLHFRHVNQLRTITFAPPMVSRMGILRRIQGKLRRAVYCGGFLRSDSYSSRVLRSYYCSLIEVDACILPLQE